MSLKQALAHATRRAKARETVEPFIAQLEKFAELEPWHRIEALATVKAEAGYSKFTDILETLHEDLSRDEHGTGDND